MERDRKGVEIQALKRKVEQLQQDSDELLVENSVLRVQKEALKRKIGMLEVKVDHFNHEIGRKNCSWGCFSFWLFSFDYVNLASSTLHQCRRATF